MTHSILRNFSLVEIRRAEMTHLSNKVAHWTFSFKILIPFVNLTDKFPPPVMIREMNILFSVNSERTFSNFA